MVRTCISPCVLTIHVCACVHWHLVRTFCSYDVLRTNKTDLFIKPRGAFIGLEKIAGFGNVLSLSHL